jgi:hypothetical protein
MIVIRKDNHRILLQGIQIGGLNESKHWNKDSLGKLKIMPKGQMIEPLARVTCS